MLKYFVEFSEKVDPFSKEDLSELELETITAEISNIIHDALRLAGFKIYGDKIKVEFDLEDYEQE